MSYKNKKVVKKRALPSHVIVFVRFTFNNTLFSINGSNGNVLIWLSSGTEGFKNTKRGTPYAANKTAQKVCKILQTKDVQTCIIELRGISSCRDIVIKTILNSSISVLSIVESLKIPYNGCRPKKGRTI